jgi:hypothetical protein
MEIELGYHDGKHENAHEEKDILVFLLHWLLSCLMLEWLYPDLLLTRKELKVSYLRMAY